jgi:PAS domain S-box-containing protein
MLGYDREELLARGISDVIPPDDASISLEAIEQIYDTGNSSRKGHLRKKDGSSVSVIIDAVNFGDGNMMAFCKDLTAYEKTETLMDQYYSAFQSISQPVLITDRNGIIVSVNAAMANMYGFTERETVGKNPHILNPGRAVYENLGVSNEEYDALFLGLWIAVRDPETRTWEGVVINKRKDGTLVWVNLVVTGIFDTDKRLTSIIGMPIDITHAKEIESKERLRLYQTIADLAELRDNETGNHMKRVGIFAKLLARACGMNEKYCNDIEIFAPMHDIGKVGILDSILRAPRKLTVEEFEVMKTHTLLGHNIVKGKEGLEMAAEITLYHHERYNGKGYPFAIPGNEIPLSAQITALADVYDALRSARPYKDAWTHEKTMGLMLSGEGKEYNPDLMDLFKELAPRFESVFQSLRD